MIFEPNTAHAAIKMFSTICGLLSVNIRSGMPYGMKQSSTVIHTKHLSVFVSVRIALVFLNSNLSLWWWICCRLLSATWDWGRSLRKIGVFSLTGRASRGVDFLVFVNVVCKTCIFPRNVDVICHMRPVIRPSHRVVYTFCSKMAGYCRVVLVIKHFCPQEQRMNF